MFISQNVALWFYANISLSCKLFLTSNSEEIFAGLHHAVKFYCWRLYLHVDITVGEDVKQAYLQEVLKEKERRKKIVCFQSAIKQTINVLLKPNIQVTIGLLLRITSFGREHFIKLHLIHDAFTDHAEQTDIPLLYKSHLYFYLQQGKE